MLVDFDGSSADMHQHAQTFANAVKAGQPTYVLPAPPQPNGAALALPSPPNYVTPIDQEPAPSAEPPNESAPVAAQPKDLSGVAKRVRTPKYLTDLDFKAGPKSLTDFVEEQ